MTIIQFVFRKCFLIIYFICLSFYQPVLAQSSTEDSTNSKRLAIGDRLPDELWNMALQVVNHPQGKKTITLSEYKDKLIILDFWATWCVPCIKSMPKLDTLQNEFSNDIIVVPITAELAEEVVTFVKKKGWKLPSVIENKSVEPFFPHGSIPHQVWIRDGKLIAEVGAESAKRENILTAIKDQPLRVIMKKEDVSFDLNLPLFYNGNGGELKDIKIRSIITPRIKAEIAGINRSANRILFYNAFASNLIYECVRDYIPYHGRYNRIIWEVPDSIKINLNGEAKDLTGYYEQDIEFLKWREENSYCYELMVHPELMLSKKELRSIMRSDLQRFFSLTKGIQFKIENRRMLAYSIVETGLQENNESLIKNDSPDKYFTLRDQPIEKLYMYVSAVLAEQEYPFTDFSPSTNANLSPSGKLVTVQIDKNDLTAEGIKNQLRNFGFDLNLSDHELAMLIIHPYIQE